MARPKIRIKTAGIKAKIFIDGVEIKGVRGYQLKHTAGGLPILEVDLKAVDIEIDGDIIPTLPEIYKGFYEKRAD